MVSRPGTIEHSDRCSAVASLCPAAGRNGVAVLPYFLMTLLPDGNDRGCASVGRFSASLSTWRPTWNGHHRCSVTRRRRRSINDCNRDPAFFLCPGLWPWCRARRSPGARVDGLPAGKIEADRCSAGPGCPAAGHLAWRSCRVVMIEAGRWGGSAAVDLVTWTCRHVPLQVERRWRP
jgi:hypothetical protein